MTRSIHECWHLRTNKCVRTNICKKSVFVVSVRNINICGRILTQFTGLLRTNTVAAKRNLLAERTGLGKSVSVSLRNLERALPNQHRRDDVGSRVRYPHCPCSFSGQSSTNRLLDRFFGPVLRAGLSQITRVSTNRIPAAVPWPVSKSRTNN